MTYTEALQKYGLPASPVHRDEIRRLLVEEIELSREGKSREEILRTLCVQLFSIGVVEDSLLIWEAKMSDFDAACGLDIQFLCGAGLQATKDFLVASTVPVAAEALQYLDQCNQDFEGWTPQETLSGWQRYYEIS